MNPNSSASALMSEDLRLTAYRLEVVRGMPADAYRDALIAGLAARLDALMNDSACAVR